MYSVTEIPNSFTILTGLVGLCDLKCLIFSIILGNNEEYTDFVVAANKSSIEQESKGFPMEKTAVVSMIKMFKSFCISGEMSRQNFKW